jgi:hypothetical protein
MASSPVTSRSDGEGELGEGSREPIPGINVGGQFVVAAACHAIPTRHVLTRQAFPSLRMTPLGEYVALRSAAHRDSSREVGPGRRGSSPFRLPGPTSLR